MTKKKAWYKRLFKFVRNILFFFLGYRILKKIKVQKNVKTFVSEIVNKSKDNSLPIVVYLSHYDYFYPLQQRPNHIFNLLSDSGFICVMCGATKDVCQVRSNLYVIPFSWMSYLVKIEFSKTYITSIGFPYKDIKNFDKYIDDSAFVIYELFDDFELISSNVRSRAENLFNYLIKRENTFVITSADDLYKKAINMGTDPLKILMVKNGVNIQDFKKDSYDVPDAMKRVVKKGKPIIGYYGALTATWFDFPLMLNIVKEQQEYEFVLIGLKYGDENIDKTEKFISELQKNSNFTYIPPVDYSQLPYYAHCFNVGIIPFQINEITKACSPVKLFEYMAMGLPIVTTSLEECKLYKSCFISNNVEEFLLNIKKAIDAKDKLSYQKILINEANANTWKSRVDDIIAIINTNIGENKC